MAILAPPDWQYSPRDTQMDKGPTPPAGHQQQPQQQQQRPHQLPPPQIQYPFTQQPQGTWTPSLAAPPFYPANFYQNSPNASPGVPGPYPAPYFDPANAQLAQWAYQQMMFNAQQQQQHGMAMGGPQPDFFAPPPGMHGAFNPFPSGTPPPRQESHYNSNNTGNGANQAFHPYRRPARQQSSHSESAAQQPQQDWRPHQPPYGRSDASASSGSVNTQGRARTDSNNSQRGSSSNRGSPSPVGSAKGSNTVQPPGGPPPRIPHHRAGSSSSTHSAHSAHQSGTPSGSVPTSSSSSGAASSSSSLNKLRPSPLSQGAVTASAIPPSSASPRPTIGGATTSRAERRISRDDSSLALSSLSLLASRAESNQNPALPSGTHKGSGGGLKGRLRRALSFNASVALREEVGADDEPDLAEEETDATDADGDGSDESIKASVVNPGRVPAGSAIGATPRTPALIRSAVRKPGAADPFPPPAPSTGSALASASQSSSAASPSSSAGVIQPLPKKKSRAASLFNTRLNASTDNISLSSTVSSASVMIRKLGSMGRLARRNSLAGITGLFKDRKKKEAEADGDGEDVEGGGKDKKKDKKKDKEKNKSGKGEASEASVSHATAELEAGDWSVPDAGVAGLSPAAKLARQHTLKSHAEERAKAAARAANAAANDTATNGVNGGGVNSPGGGGVPVWDRNTATRRGPGGGGVVGEDGVFVEESESDDDDDAYGPPQPQSQSQYQQENAQQQQQQRWDDEDDEEWGLLGGEEDDTIRVGIPGAAGEEEEGEEDDHEPWAVDIRRSAERTRMPAKGILKHAGTYDQATYRAEVLAGNAAPLALRTRSNSYSPPAGERSEPGPLARIPSPDPDHIDGLSRHGSHSSHHEKEKEGSAGKRSSVPSLPPLAFEVDGSAFESPGSTPTASTYAQAGVQLAAPAPAPAAPMYNHPALNSSAPALTTLGLGLPGGHPPLAHRAATTPAKKLAFASNLSVYDTFSASMYDRRSEPATWSRLTPALAQRIKEELNSYKMEEMEVHAASRIHTQFFV